VPTSCERAQALAPRTREQSENAGGAHTSGQAGSVCDMAGGSVQGDEDSDMAAWISEWERIMMTAVPKGQRDAVLAGSTSWIAMHIHTVSAILTHPHKLARFICANTVSRSYFLSGHIQTCGVHACVSRRAPDYPRDVGELQCDLSARTGC
jgi:hypothetical protein